MKQGIFSYSGTARGLKAVLDLQAVIDSVKETTKKLRELNVVIKKNNEEIKDNLTCRKCGEPTLGRLCEKCSI